MLEGLTQNALVSSEVARAALDWWALAGVDCAVSETPVNRLARGQKSINSKSLVEDVHAGMTAGEAEQLPAMPDTLEAFVAWLANTDQVPESAIVPSHDRASFVMPRLNAGAPVMLVVESPGEADVSAGELLAGEAAAFLSALLRALRLERDRVSVASLFLLPTGGAVPAEAAMNAAAARLRHLVMLAAPAWLIVLGDRTSRAWDRTDSRESCENLPFVNHGGVTVRTVHAPALPMLMRKAERKAGLWRDLRGFSANR